MGVAGDVVYASSYENPTILPSSAILDNEAHTRWASQQQDNECLIFDFKSPVIFDLIKVRWEVSFARIFKIYTHPETTSTSPTRDDDGWTYLTGTEAGLGEVDTFKLTEEATSRYVKVDLIQRETSENTKKQAVILGNLHFLFILLIYIKKQICPQLNLVTKWNFLIIVQHG